LLESRGCHQIVQRPAPATCTSLLRTEAAIPSEERRGLINGRYDAFVYSGV
jgi:hypothetical protein